VSVDNPRFYCAKCLQFLSNDENHEDCPHCHAELIWPEGILTEYQYLERKSADQRAEREARESGLIR
jgi:hypothetical protein